MSLVAPVHLVAVHGNGGGGLRFSAVHPHVPGSIVLHAPTLPGFGGRPLGAVDGVDGLAADLAATIAALPRPRVVLGHGIGGSVALQMVASAPDLVDGLILHAPVGTRLDTRWFPRVMSRPAVRQAAQSIISSRRARPLLRRLLLREVEPALADRVLAAYGDAEAFGAMFAWLTADWFDALPVLDDLPTVILWGAKDRVLGADQRSDYLRLLPQAHEVTIPDWGHFPMLDRPAAYAERIALLATGLVHDHGATGTP